jgi:hypothetical protein
VQNVFLFIIPNRPRDLFFFSIFVGKPEGTDSEDPVIDGRIILKWILRKQGRRAWTGLIWPRI